MKKLTVLIFFVFISAFVFGQRFGGGVMGGVVGSQVAGDTYSGFRKAGVFVGGFVYLPVSPHSIFQLELEYFQKGSRHNPDYEKNPNDYPYLFRVNYIEMPLLYQYKFNDRIKMEFGPSVGFLVNYYEKANEEVESDKPGYNKPAPATFQLNLGIYVYLTDKIAVNLRTNNSFSNIRTENRTGDVWRLWAYGQFNDSLILSLHYNIKKKNK